MDCTHSRLEFRQLGAVLVSCLLLFVAATADAQDLDIATRPEAIYVESLPGDIAPMDRAFFHIIIHNTSESPVSVDWIRFDLSDSEGASLSGHYSGAALTRLFDSAMDRRRIEPSLRDSLILGPDQRKAITDIFLDSPAGFMGDTLVVEVQYRSGDESRSQTAFTPLERVSGFAGQLPFEGTWYVASEHGHLDAHKRFAAEAFAYDFLQIGGDGRSYRRNGNRNSDYYAYGKRVLASKDGVVVSVQPDIADNEPGMPDAANPGGNVVIIDHGNDQYGYYAHLRRNSILVEEGSRVSAGEVIGEVGNSGDAAEPHLHFHVMNRANPEEAEGIPAVFANWQGQAYSRSPILRPLAPLPRGEFVEP